MSSQHAPTEIPVHDVDRDGNIFAWVLRLAAERRANASTFADHRAAYDASISRKFHELPAADRSPIVLPPPVRIA